MIFKRNLITLMSAGALVLLFSSVASAQEYYPREVGSWGGKVRGGPGENYPRIDGLKEGDPVTLLENAGNYQGVPPHDYPWFRIRFKNGRIGYKWGGILCGYNETVPGIARTCTRDNRHNVRHGHGGGAPQVVKPTCPSGFVLSAGNCVRTAVRDPATTQFTFLDGYDLYGGDYSTLPGKVHFDDCEYECKYDQRCKSFTYNTQASKCFLKSYVPQRSPFKNAISGIKQ